MKNIHKGRAGSKTGICGVIIAAGIAVITGCGINAATETSYTADSALWKDEKWDSVYTEQSSILTETDSLQTEQKTVSVMGSVPYFRDDAGQNTQTVDGYLYGYWNNRLCRYDLETLEETVLYEAVSPQNGDFCIWGDYVYFMEVPNVNAVEKLYGYLYRVKCDGSEEAILLTSVVMPSQSYGGSYYHSYILDTYEDILYLILQHDKEENLYFRLDQEGNITQVEESETLYGRLPEREFSGWPADWSYGSLMTLPYAMRNYGYVFMRDAAHNPVRIDLESQKMEVMDVLRYYVIYTVTNDSFIVSRDGVWYRVSLDDLDEVQEIGRLLDGREEMNPQLVAWNEEGLYFTTGSEEYSGDLYFVDWEGRWTSIGSSVSGSSVLMSNNSPVVYFNGQYYYYVANSNGVNLVRRLDLTDDKEKVAEEVAVYSEEPGCEIAYRESTNYKWTDIYTRDWVDYSMTKVILREDTAAFSKINEFLEDLYTQDMALVEDLYAQGMALVEEYEEAARESTGEDGTGSYGDYVECSSSYSVCYLDEDYVGIKGDWGEYRKDAVHGWYGSKYYMFDRHTGNRVAITDVTGYSPEEICEIMAPYVKAAANKGTDKEGWESILLEENRFFMSEEGIGLHFDSNDIAIWGTRDVIVPYAVFDFHP